MQIKQFLRILHKNIIFFLSYLLSIYHLSVSTTSQLMCEKQTINNYFTMLRCDRDIIRQNFVFLCKEIPCKELVPILFEQCIFSAQVAQEILSEPLHQQNMSFLFILMRRGPKAFAAFIQALKLINRSDIIDALNINHFEQNFSNLKINDESAHSQ